MITTDLGTALESGDALYDEEVSRRVSAVRQRPVDNPPWPRTVRQMQDLADPRFVHRMRRAISAHELRRVELADLAFANAPHDSGHPYMVARGNSPEMRDLSSPELAEICTLPSTVGL